MSNAKNNLISVRVHIANVWDYCDDKAFVVVDLPSVPRVGESIWLTNEQREELKRKIKKIPDYRNSYQEYMCTYKPKSQEKEGDPIFLDIDDAIYVTGVLYQGEGTVHVELYFSENRFD